MRHTGVPGNEAHVTAHVTTTFSVSVAMFAFACASSFSTTSFSLAERFPLQAQGHQHILHKLNNSVWLSNIKPFHAASIGASGHVTHTICTPPIQYIELFTTESKGAPAQDIHNSKRFSDGIPNQDHSLRKA